MICFNMKATLLRIIGFSVLLIILGCNGGKEKKQVSDDNAKNVLAQSSPILIGYTKESYDIAKFLSQQYSYVHPDKVLRLEEINSQKIDSILKVKMFDFIFTTKMLDTMYDRKRLVDEIFLFALNFDNPAVPKVAMKGLSIGTLKNVFTTVSITNWNQVFKDCPSQPIKPMTPPSEHPATKQLIQFFKANVLSNYVLPSYDQVRNYLFMTTGAVAFLSIKDVYDSSSGLRKKGIYPLFLDLNDNHFLEDQELFFDNINQLKKAYLNNQYPSVLAVKHYLYFLKTSTRPELNEFSTFIDQNAINLLEPLGYIKPK